ncbi:MAG: hypothetical protein ACUVXJ_12620 [Phycisphaerae bacterium]
MQCERKLSEGRNAQLRYPDPLALSLFPLSRHVQAYTLTFAPCFLRTDAALQPPVDYLILMIGFLQAKKADFSCPDHKNINLTSVELSPGPPVEDAMLQTPSPLRTRMARLGIEPVETADPRAKQLLHKRKSLFQNILCSIEVAEAGYPDPERAMTI